MAGGGGESGGLQARTWHDASVEDVTARLGTEIDRGLAPPEVERRRAIHGLNQVTVKEAVGPLRRFLLQLHQPLVYALLAAATVTLVLEEWVDAGVVLGVVLVNAVIGYLQEAKALQALDALARAVTTEATVLRGGRKVRLPSADLVPGDIVLLQSGDKVPADLRLARTRDLQVDESALTGESLPVTKDTAPLPADTPLGDRRSMAFSSALVTYGQATGIVVATGDATEVGRISSLIASAEGLATPLVRKIARFSGILLYAILALAALTFGVGILRGESAQDMFMAAVALAVGAIPEGLPAAMTITLAIGVGRMAKRRAIIRRLPAVEALGSTTVICSDKTGTLTENQMTVTAIEAGGASYDVSGAGYAKEGRVSGAAGAADASPGTALGECLLAGLLCNDTAIATKEGRASVQGDPTEAALLVSAAKGGLDEEVQRRRLPRADTIPFESEHQYMATLHDAGPGRPRPVYLKGSVEAVLQRCSGALAAEGARASLATDAIHAAVEAMAARGLRVLAFARGEMPPDAGALRHDDVAAGLTFLGLQGMIDPPRQAAIAAVESCRRAGVRVKMITGDHAGTALAIARQLRLAPGPEGLTALTGRDLEKLSGAEFEEAAARTAVFARVTPQQKLRLVKALQARGEVVAMTGDGVNDAPALKQADIGVAMGITGTDVAKEAADMILTDDDFATITAAVEEGRGVFDNLTKFIVWTLPTNLGEGLVILAAVLLGTTLPILPVQILWINMTTAVFLGLTLAFETKEPDIMERRPREPDTPILTRALVDRIVLVSFFLLAGSFGLFAWMLRGQGATEAEARTVAVNVFVVVELVYLLNCRSLERSMLHVGLLSNRWLLGGVALMLLLQVAFTYAPPMNRMFQSAPVDLRSWVAVFGVATLASAAVGAEKLVRRRWAARAGAG